MADDLLIADRQARRDAMDISRSFIVQAPAGSGKTELLIQRYLRLLGVVDEPEEIVAITFTRKAAHEMRERVVDALHNASDPVEPTEEYRRITCEAARSVLQRDRDRGWDLLASPARMRIQTLDAFNAGIARTLPVSSGLGGISRTIADGEMQSFYRQAAIATIDWLSSNDSISEAVKTVLEHLDNNAMLFVSYVARMLQSRDQWLALIGSGIGETGDYQAARHKLEGGIADVIGIELQQVRNFIPPGCVDEFVSLLDYAGGNLATEGNKDDPGARLRGLTRLPTASPNDVDAWKAITHMLLVKTGALIKTVNKNKGFPTGDSGQKKAFLEIVETFREIEGLDVALKRVHALPPQQYSDEQWAVLVALFRLLPVAVAELRQIFDSRSVCDHIEVGLAASAALGSFDSPGEVALKLDYRIRHLLVDEMQDTSLGQYQLLQTLTEGWTPGDGRTLFCVGDPMQSIYRFRDAEVGQFVVARENGIGTVRLESRQLRRNFRSGEHLVHWFNTVFSQVMPLRDDVSAGAIAYAESVPVEMHAGRGSFRLHALVDKDAMAEAEAGTEVIRRCLSENPGDDVVVLVRSRSQLAELLASLRDSGIPYEAVEIDRLTDLPELTDLLALTRALCHETDRMAWLGLLHGPTVGLSWQDIVALVKNDTQRSVLELVRDTERQRQLTEDGRARVQAFEQAILPYNEHTAVEPLRERVERCWYALGGPGLIRTEQQLANVYQYFAVLEKLEVAGTLADVAELESQLDQERASSLPGSDCKLQIMTMHKSKGLQFDHVILYGLGRGTRVSQKSVLSWLTLPDNVGNDMIISPVGARSVLEHDPLHQFIGLLESDKQRHELDRLLYVAATRAKKTLHLIGNVNSVADGAEIRGARAGSLLDRLWPAVEHEYQQLLLNQPHRETAAASLETDNYKDPVSRRYTNLWQGSPPPSLPIRITEQIDSDALSEHQVEFHWVGAGSRHAGTIVHRWLHRMTLGKVSIDDDAGSRDAITRKWARQLGVSETAGAAVCDRVERALQGIATDETGRWLLQGEGHAELPLTGIWNGRIVAVVIDRIRIDDNGTHWIVDYKSGAHEGGDVQGFLAQEADRYRAQLDKYAAVYSAIVDAPIRTALYFPLLQAFREL